MAEKDSFHDWILNIDNLSKNTANLYSNALETISNQLLDIKEIEKNIYSIYNYREIDIVLKKFDNHFDIENVSGHNLKSSALKKYQKYLIYLNKKTNIYVHVDKIDDEIDKIERGLNKINDTEKSVIIKSRIGQTMFRNGLLRKYNHKCQLCNIDIQELLVASHIKPWFKSNKKEKLDLNNGLLLCCLHDKLFDLGLISFNENGNVVFSNNVNRLV